jgi:hypothetical protein
MKFVKSIISRVRWNVVISIIAVVVLIPIAFIFLKPFTPQFRCSNGLCMNSYAEPREITPAGESTLWVEISNRGDDDLVVDVSLKARNDVLFFKETNAHEVEREVGIGPKETRKLNFDVTASAAYSGTYRTDVIITYNNEEINDEVYITVL